MKRGRSHFLTKSALVATTFATGCGLFGQQGVDSRLVRLSLRSDATGCWALFDQSGHTAQGSLYWAPAMAQLLDTRDAAETGEFRLIRLDSLGRDMRSDRELDLSYWSADSRTDSIRIGVRSKFSGTEFIFALPAAGRGRDTLRGRAYEHWDYKANTNRGRATAVRRSCPEPS